jgi:prephenate dehydrogenase
MKIVIMGAGHMGSWLAKALSGAHEVALCSRTSSKAASVAANLKNVKALAKVDDIAGFAPDLFINAVSLDNTVPAFESALPHLGKDCALCDVTSVKGALPEFYRKAGRRFVSLHPMFGPTFANVDSLRDENAVIIIESDAQLSELFADFFKSLGLNLFRYTFEEHDRMMAYSLSLPFASTLVFASCMDSHAVPGTTFRKHMAIAHGILSEDDHLLSEILFNEYTIDELEKVTSKLEHLKHIIMSKDDDEMRKFLRRLRDKVGK